MTLIYIGEQRKGRLIEALRSNLQSIDENPGLEDTFVNQPAGTVGLDRLLSLDHVEGVVLVGYQRDVFGDPGKLEEFVVKARMRHNLPIVALALPGQEFPEAGAMYVIEGALSQGRGRGGMSIKQMGVEIGKSLLLDANRNVKARSGYDDSNGLAVIGHQYTENTLYALARCYVRETGLPAEVYSGHQSDVMWQRITEQHDGFLLLGNDRDVLNGGAQIELGNVIEDGDKPVVGIELERGQFSYTRDRCTYIVVDRPGFLKIHETVQEAMPHLQD